MAFTIPNAAAASFPSQAEVFQADVDILVAGVGGYSVLNGCAVTTSGAADNKVNVAAGAVDTGGTFRTIAAGSVTLTAPDGTNPRIDIVWVDNTGALGKTNGTAAATPAPPALPASTVALAFVYSPAAGGNTVGATWITDKRVVLVSSGSCVVKNADESVTTSTVLQDDNDLVLALDANTDYQFDVWLKVADGGGGGNGAIKCAFTVPAGASLDWSAIWQTGATTILASSVISVSGTSVTMSTSDTSAWVRVNGTVRVGATAGNLQLQWAQGTSSGTATTVKAGSRIKATREGFA